jgi:hypothetical protein
MCGQIHVPASLSREKNPGTYLAGGWLGPEPMWKDWRREKSIAPVGNRTPDLPSHCLVTISTFRIKSYISHKFINQTVINFTTQTIRTLIGAWYKTTSLWDPQVSEWLNSTKYYKRVFMRFSVSSAYELQQWLRKVTDVLKIMLSISWEIRYFHSLLGGRMTWIAFFVMVYQSVQANYKMLP